jgi:peptidyl-prolyl cis-trans isomerase A (cyclophilin A)
VRIPSLVAIALAFPLAGCGETRPAPAPPAAPPALLTPDPAAVAAAAPDSFSVVLTTSKGEVEIRVRRAWAPLGADRVHYLAEHGFFAGNRFFRVLPGFIAQFGLSGIPEVDAAFDRLKLVDDPARITNRRGTLVFATAGPNTRTTQLFINLADNANLDRMGFAPVGEVVRGLEVVQALYAGYGEGYPYGSGPDQGRVMREGNRYLRVGYPLLDTIATASVRP